MPDVLRPILWRLMKTLFAALAILVLAFVVLGYSGSARGAPSVASAESDPITVNDAANVSVSAEQTVAFAEDSAIPNRIRVQSTASVHISVDVRSIDNPTKETLDYFYLDEYLSWKPPSFNGLGGNHFARADV